MEWMDSKDQTLTKRQSAIQLTHVKLKMQKPGESVNFVFLGKTCESFPEGKLPETGDVLKVFLYHHRILRKTIKESAKITSNMLIYSWTTNTSKLIIKDHNVIKKIKEIFYDWVKVKKNSNNSSGPAQYRNERKFLDKLEDTFDIALKTEEAKKRRLEQPLTRKRKAPPAKDSAQDDEYCQPTIRSAKINCLQRTKEQFYTEKFYASCSSESDPDDSDEEYEEELPKTKISKEIPPPDDKNP